MARPRRPAVVSGPRARPGDRLGPWRAGL